MKNIKKLIDMTTENSKDIGNAVGLEAFNIIENAAIEFNELDQEEPQEKEEVTKSGRQQEMDMLKMMRDARIVK